MFQQTVLQIELHPAARHIEEQPRGGAGEDDGHGEAQDPPKLPQKGLIRRVRVPFQDVDGLLEVPWNRQTHPQSRPQEHHAGQVGQQVLAEQIEDETRSGHEELEDGLPGAGRFCSDAEHRRISLAFMSAP